MDPIQKVILFQWPKVSYRLFGENHIGRSYQSLDQPFGFFTPTKSYEEVGHG